MILYAQKQDMSYSRTSILRYEVLKSSIKYWIIDGRASQLDFVRYKEINVELLTGGDDYIYDSTDVS